MASVGAAWSSMEQWGWGRGVMLAVHWAADGKGPARRQLEGPEMTVTCLQGESHGSRKTPRDTQPMSEMSGVWVELKMGLSTSKPSLGGREGTGPHALGQHPGAPHRAGAQ